jgi:hypothetical protein
MVEPIAVPLSRAEVEAWAAEVAAISPAYVEAFDSHDMEAIRLLLADDFIFRDVGVPTVEGVDAFTRLMDQMFQAELKDMRWRVLSDFDAGFVGGDGGLMVLELWGYFGFTEENPDVAVYRLASPDDLIASIDLYYRDEELPDAITGYAAAWSSGDPTQVVELFDPAHVRQDTVFGIHTEGVEALSMTATNFFADHPNAVWEAQMFFDGNNSHVGFFSITDTDGCPVRVAVLIDPDDGKITHEEVYYEAAQLLACGWLD